MNTMTVTKIVGGVCGSLLILLLLKWGAATIYAPGGHGEMEPAYVLEIEEPAAPTETASTDTEATGDTAVAEVAEVVEPTFAELLASADLTAGEKVFKKCKACHKIEDGKNATGPHLFGVLDRTQAGVEGFRYSDVFLGMSGTWTAEELNAFVKRPKDYAPGTKMSFAGVKSEEDRANLIAYLGTIGG